MGIFTTTRTESLREEIYKTKIKCLYHSRKHDYYRDKLTLIEEEYKQELTHLKE